MLIRVNQNNLDACLSWVKNIDNTSQAEHTRILDLLSSMGFESDIALMFEKKPGEIRGVFVIINKCQLFVCCNEEQHLDDFCEQISNFIPGFIPKLILGSLNFSKLLFQFYYPDQTNLAGYFKKEIFYKIEKINFDDNEHNTKAESFNHKIAKQSLSLRNTLGTELMGFPPREISDSQINEEIKKLRQNAVALEVKNQTVVSTARFINIYKKTGLVGGVVTHREYRSKGYSQKVMKSLLKKGFVQLQLDTICLHTAEDNKPARKVYENMNFKEFGACGMYVIPDQ